MHAFAEMPGDVSRICGITAHDLARIHVSYYRTRTTRTTTYSFTTPRGVAISPPRRAWPLLLLFRSDPPPLGPGGRYPRKTVLPVVLVDEFIHMHGIGAKPWKFNHMYSKY